MSKSTYAVNDVFVKSSYEDSSVYDALFALWKIAIINKKKANFTHMHWEQALYDYSMIQMKVPRRLGSSSAILRMSQNFFYPVVFCKNLQCDGQQLLSLQARWGDFPAGTQLVGNHRFQDNFSGIDWSRADAVFIERWSEWDALDLKGIYPFLYDHKVFQSDFFVFCLS